jgi:hypothetical protein
VQMAPGIMGRIGGLLRGREKWRAPPQAGEVSVAHCLTGIQISTSPRPDSTSNFSPYRSKKGEFGAL